MRKKILWAVLGVIIILGGFYYYTSAGTEVETADVNRGGIEHTVVDTGYVQAVNQTDIFVTQGGRVASLLVSVGQNVEQGQVIMILDNQDLKMGTAQLQIQLSQANAAISAAEASLQQSDLDLADVQAQYNRSQELLKAGAISQTEFDAVRLLLEKTQAGIEAQQQSLKSAQEQVRNYQSLLNSSRQKEGELQIKSPMKGIIMQLPVQQEDVVGYGTLLARVAPPGDLEVKVDILSDDLGEVQIGQKARITAPVLGDQVLEGEVTKIYPQAEEKQSALGVIQRRVPTILKLSNTGNLKPGYEARVTIVTGGKDNVLLIPREALITSAKGDKEVMVVANNRIVLKSVSTGLYDSKNVEITEGLKEGEQIVKDGSVVLKANSRVKTRQV